MKKTGGWIFPLLVASALVFGLGLVWLNIERVDLAYEIKSMRGELAEKRELVAKLEVERGNLAGPHRLKKLAAKLGLSPAVAGQIRRVEADR